MKRTEMTRLWCLNSSPGCMVSISPQSSLNSDSITILVIASLHLPGHFWLAGAQEVSDAEKRTEDRVRVFQQFQDVGKACQWTEAIYLEGQHSKTHHSWTLECLGNGYPESHRSWLNHAQPENGSPRNLGPWRIPTLNRNGVWWNGPKLSDESIGRRGAGVGKVKVSRSTWFLFCLFQVFKSHVFILTQRLPFWGVKLPNVLQVMDWKVAMKKRTGRNTPVACLRMLSTKLHPQASLRSTEMVPT